MQKGSSNNLISQNMGLLQTWCLTSLPLLNRRLCGQAYHNRHSKPKCKADAAAPLLVHCHLVSTNDLSHKLGKLTHGGMPCHNWLSKPTNLCACPRKPARARLPVHDLHLGFRQAQKPASMHVRAKLGKPPRQCRRSTYGWGTAHATRVHSPAHFRTNLPFLNNTRVVQQPA